MGRKITPKELESFYSNVDAVCEEIFGVGTIYVDIDSNILKARKNLEKTKIIR